MIWALPFAFLKNYLFIYLVALGLPGLFWWLSWWRSCLQCGRCGFDPWIGKIPWRREWLPTPVFWPGEFHGLYSPWGCKELDMTERLSLGLSCDMWHVPWPGIEPRPAVFGAWTVSHWTSRESPALCSSSSIDTWHVALCPYWIIIAPSFLIVALLSLDDCGLILERSWGSSWCHLFFL